MAFAERLTTNEELEGIRTRLPSVAELLPSDGRLCSFAPGTALAMILAALWRDGACILKNAVLDECADRVVAEMTPYMDALSKGDTFTGTNTTRAGAVVARSPASWEIVAHPVLLQVCEAIIGRQIFNKNEEGLAATFHRSFPGAPAKRTTSRAHPFQCHLHQIIKIGPDEPAQAIHRDEGAFVMDFGEPHLRCSSVPRLLGTMTTA